MNELVQDDSATPDPLVGMEPVLVPLDDPTGGVAGPGTGGWRRFVARFDQVNGALDPDEDASTLSMEVPELRGGPRRTRPPAGPPAEDEAASRDSGGVRWLPDWAVESLIPALPPWAVESLIPNLPEWAIRPLSRGRRLKTAVLVLLAACAAGVAIAFLTDPTLGEAAAAVFSRLFGIPETGIDGP